MNPSARPTILVTGATGYVGGRLLRALEAEGHRIRCLARRPESLRATASSSTTIVRGDVLDGASLQRALDGVDIAYYLIHSMGAPGSFEELDRRGARNFAAACRRAGVQRILYLGGLAETGRGLSSHMRSRHEVGTILRDSGIPTLEFRASIVLGSGSLSFEMIRALVEHLPVMTTPRWVSVPAQPIGIDDLVRYLVAGLDISHQGSRVYEIGGADQTSYAGLMMEYARQRGLKRLILPVPVLTPWLSSLWLGLVTPLYTRIGRILIESIRHPSRVLDTLARTDFPIRPLGYREAMAAALRDEDRALADTRWSDVLDARSARRARGGLYVDSRAADVRAAPAAAFAPIRRIGGATGWYHADWLWKLRGAMDRLAGGVGMGRGRPDADVLRVGDTLDCWRVVAFEPDRRLLLAAEMKLPGRAWLAFEVRENRTGSVIRQTAIFDPLGLGGRAYWHILRPLHNHVFAGMLRGIVERAGGPGRLQDTRRRTPAAQTIGLLVIALVVAAAAATGAALTRLSVGSWYQALVKPSWTPPDSVFGPVWSLLYAAMAAAAWLVWRHRRLAEAKAPLLLFALQLALNVAWSGAFFGLRNPAAAVAVIAFLWFAIAATLATFSRRRPLAGWLLVPYLAWVTYAAGLNLAIWSLNR